MLDFTGQTVIVAGGAGGIGGATADLLSARGAHVWVADRQEPAASSAARRSHSRVVDMTDGPAVTAFVDEVTSTTGRIDAAVNAVGWTLRQDFTKDTVDYWQQVLDINLLSTLLLASEVVPTMRRAGYGRFVAVSSLAGRVGEPRSAVYSAAKAGVLAFVKALAREMADSGVTVNSVAPGAVRTPLLERQGASLVRATARAVPLGRISEPIEQARAIAFLASPEASYITGQTLSVDGGLSMV